jgi:hypothetical protein
MDIMILDNNLFLLYFVLFIFILYYLANYRDRSGTFFKTLTLCAIIDL